ncbi:hypothetical protein D3C84_1304510 [compost metagenome]
MHAGAIRGASAFARRKVVQIDSDIVHPIILNACIHMMTIIAERQFFDSPLLIILKSSYYLQLIEARG